MSVYHRIAAITSGDSNKVLKNDEFSQLFALNCTDSGGVFRERDKSGDIFSSGGLCYALKQKKAVIFVNF